MKPEKVIEILDSDGNFRVLPSENEESDILEEIIMKSNEPALTMKIDYLCVYGPPPIIEEEDEPRIIDDVDDVYGPPPMIEEDDDDELMPKDMGS